tara:strand:- start:1334 stop:2161 length:828 start_codon:yes stop_codon:yes gene_type:complete
MQIDREDFLQEQELRLFVRKAIKVVQEKTAFRSSVQPADNKEETKGQLLEEEQLRQIIRKLLTEDVRSQLSTGMKELELLLKKIIPQLEDDYKLLTTDPTQRESFRAHIIHAVQNTLSTVLPDGTPAQDTALAIAEAEINVDIEDEGEPDGFIPVRDQDVEKAADQEEPEELSDVEKFGIEGKDLTGRNMAFRSYKSVEKVIGDSYALLGNEEDRNEFYDYLITNLKLHFDKFEDELADDLDEPSTPAYEKEKEEMDSRVDVEEPPPMETPEEPL